MINIKERYCYIDGHDDYIITEYGDVYSLKYKSINKMALKGRQYKDRYISIGICENNKVKYMQIHRLVAKYFCSGYFEGAVVNHIDGNKHNNYYKNLEWTTHKDNIHKSYITSGVDQTRNYKNYIIVNKDGTKSNLLKGIGGLKQYILDNNLNVSITSLTKYCSSKGYKLIKFNKYQTN